MSERRPVLSVIMPVHNARHLLPTTLGALRDSVLERSQWELVVVDDASSDDSAAFAAEFADTLMHVEGGPRGPAFARNRGAEASQGSVLVFVDSDVRVAPDALEKLADLFGGDPELAAAFGAYDTEPAAPGVVSRYRNLLHHYHHRQGAGDAETFWAGLGAVRADVFRELGGYDEVRYARPQIEDIELGRRIRRAGGRILLDPTIQGTHLKRWTFGQVLKTDLLHRGVPWMRLILEEGGGGDTLNVKPKEKICVALVGLALVGLAAGVFARSWMPLGAAAGCVAVVVLLNRDLYRYFARVRSWWFALAVVPLHLTYYMTSGVAFVAGHVAHRLGPPTVRRDDGVLILPGGSHDT